MITPEHEHVAAQVLGPFSFQGCVSHDCNPLAHHGRVYMHVCPCGWVRLVNVANSTSELGDWHALEKETT